MCPCYTSIMEQMSLSSGTAYQRMEQQQQRLLKTLSVLCVISVILFAIAFLLFLFFVILIIILANQGGTTMAGAILPAILYGMVGIVALPTSLALLISDHTTYQEFTSTLVSIPSNNLVLRKKAKTLHRISFWLNLIIFIIYSLPILIIVSSSFF